MAAIYLDNPLHQSGGIRLSNPIVPLAIVGGDTVAPVITLLGTPSVNVNEGDAYVDAGATALDDVDGDITANITTVNPVDVNTPAVYTVTYNVSDVAGNAAVEVTRTVTVVALGDTTPPVITLSGAPSINHEQGDAYTDAGATASDNIDGDITANIVVGGDTVDVNTAGTYVITYDVADAAGNNATQVTRTVIVADTTLPIITILGANPLNLVQGDTYTDPGATASDNINGDITGSIVVGGDTVDANTIGAYNVTYNVVDGSGNAAVQVLRVVNVSALPDTIAPVITLTGAPTINHEQGTTYTDLGATASDNLDGDITANIVVSGSVDVNTAGSYTINYNVSDSSGNNAIQVSRTVIVADTVIPVITLIGMPSVSHEQGTTYNDAGATALDTADGNITANIVVGGSVDVNTLGPYQLTYNVSDAAGNAAAQVVRTVTVITSVVPPTLGADQTVSIVENTTSVGTFAVVGGSTPITYSLTGTDASLLSINSSGVVTLNAAGDFESKPQYLFTVVATNSAGSDFQNITLNLTNINEVVITNPGPLTNEYPFGSVGLSVSDPIVVNYLASFTNATNVVISGNPSVLTEANSPYTVTASANDANNVNSTITVTEAADDVPPVITLNGLSVMYQTLGLPFVDPGATAIDNVDGVVAVTTSGTVNINVEAIYTLTYTATDVEGNTSSISRTVSVLPHTIAPSARIWVL